MRPSILHSITALYQYMLSQHPINLSNTLSTLSLLGGRACGAPIHTTLYNRTLSSHPITTLYQHTLSTLSLLGGRACCSPIHTTLYHHTLSSHLSTHPINLSTHPINLSTHPINPLSPRWTSLLCAHPYYTLSPHSISICSHNTLSTYLTPYQPSLS